MESVSKTVWTNFIQRLSPQLRNPVGYMKHITQLYSVWLAMVWISSQRISIHQFKWKLVTGYVFQVWEPILMDVEAHSTEWKALKKSLNGMPNFSKTMLNKKCKLNEWECFDYRYTLFFINILFTPAYKKSSQFLPLVTISVRIYLCHIQFVSSFFFMQLNFHRILLFPALYV